MLGLIYLFQICETIKAHPINDDPKLACNCCLAFSEHSITNLLRIFPDFILDMNKSEWNLFNITKDISIDKLIDSSKHIITYCNHISEEYTDFDADIFYLEIESIECVKKFIEILDHDSTRKNKNYFDMVRRALFCLIPLIDMRSKRMLEDFNEIRKYYECTLFKMLTDSLLESISKLTNIFRKSNFERLVFPIDRKDPNLDSIVLEIEVCCQAVIELSEKIYKNVHSFQINIFSRILFNVYKRNLLLLNDIYLILNFLYFQKYDWNLDITTLTGYDSNTSIDSQVSEKKHVFLNTKKSIKRFFSGSSFSSSQTNLRRSSVASNASPDKLAETSAMSNSRNSGRVIDQSQDTLNTCSLPQMSYGSLGQNYVLANKKTLDEQSLSNAPQIEFDKRTRSINASKFDFFKKKDENKFFGSSIVDRKHKSFSSIKKSNSDSFSKIPNSDNDSRTKHISGLFGKKDNTLNLPLTISTCPLKSETSKKEQCSKKIKQSKEKVVINIHPPCSDSEDDAIQNPNLSPSLEQEQPTAKRQSLFTKRTRKHSNPFQSVNIFSKIKTFTDIRRNSKCLFESCETIIEEKESLESSSEHILKEKKHLSEDPLASKEEKKTAKKLKKKRSSFLNFFSSKASDSGKQNNERESGSCNQKMGLNHSTSVSEINSANYDSSNLSSNACSPTNDNYNDGVNDDFNENSKNLTLVNPRKESFIKRSSSLLSKISGRSKIPESPISQFQSKPDESKPDRSLCISHSKPDESRPYRPLCISKLKLDESKPDRSLCKSIFSRQNSKTDTLKPGKIVSRSRNIFSESSKEQIVYLNSDLLKDETFNKKDKHSTLSSKFSEEIIKDVPLFNHKILNEANNSLDQYSPGRQENYNKQYSLNTFVDFKKENSSKALKEVIFKETYTGHIGNSQKEHEVPEYLITLHSNIDLFKEKMKSLLKEKFSIHLALYDTFFRSVDFVSIEDCQYIFNNEFSKLKYATEEEILNAGKRKSSSFRKRVLLSKKLEAAKTTFKTRSKSMMTLSGILNRPNR